MFLQKQINCPYLVLQKEATVETGSTSKIWFYWSHVGQSSWLQLPKLGLQRAEDLLEKIQPSPFQKIFPDPTQHQLHEREEKKKY